MVPLRVPKWMQQCVEHETRVQYILKKNKEVGKTVGRFGSASPNLRFCIKVDQIHKCLFPEIVRKVIEKGRSNVSKTDENQP